MKNILCFTCIFVAPSEGVQDVTAPTISPNNVTVMWMPPELENWNGILTNYTVDITAVEDCQKKRVLENFIGTPRREHLTSFENDPNPNMAYMEEGLELESLTIDTLEEYQSYTFIVRVWNNQGEGPKAITICNRTLEAGTYIHVYIGMIESHFNF